MKRSALVGIFLGFAGIAVVAGCGGGSPQVTTATLPAAPAATAARVAPAAFTIVIPAKAASASSRKPEYVSPDTNSVSFFATGMDATQVVPLTGSNCSGSGGAKTCTASFLAPIGSGTMDVKTFQSSDGSGTPLSLNSVPITITEGTTNAVNVSLNGVVASLGVVLDPTSLTAGTGGSVTATYTAYDAANDAIVGPGSLVDSTDTAIGTPTLTSDDLSPATSISAPSGNTWTVTETNPSAGSVTFTVAATGNPAPTSGAAVLTINAATPSPSPSPTDTPTPTPTPTASPTPIEAITNGDFATGDLTGWYNCYATHAGYSVPINPSPSPIPTSGQSAANPTPTPYDVSMQSTTPSGTPPPSGNSHFALVGAGTNGATTTNEPKGQSGICQTVTVPGSGATLTFNVYEGGDDSFTTTDAEADVYPSTAWATATNGALASVAPTATLFAEANCYDNLQENGLYLSSPWGTGTHAATTTARYSNCPYTPGGSTPSGTVSLGGYWYSRTFDLSGYAGNSITLFFGIWRSAAIGSNSRSTGSLNYYNYAYFDNIQLTGTP
jgi:hypothetical protein